MLGYIKKDILLLKKNFKFLGIIIIVFTIMGLIENMDISYLLTFYSVVLMLSTFNYDEYSNFNAYVKTWPNGENNYVKAKYLTAFILDIIIFIIMAIIDILMTVVHKDLNLGSLMLSLGANLGVSLILQTFLYPLIYKYGVEKARIIIFISIFAIAFLFGALIGILNYFNIELMKNISNFSLIIGLILIVVIIILGLLISYKMAKKIYNKKEF